MCLDGQVFGLAHFFLVRAIERSNVMLGKLGLPELLIIFAVALLIFGPRKIGELGKGLGDGIRSFKSAIKDEENVDSSHAN